MLHKQRSKRTAFIKYGLFLPLFAITLVMSSATIRNNEKIREVARELPVEEPLTFVKEAVNEVVKPLVSGTESTNKTLAQGVALNADWDDFYTHIKKSVRYPPNAQEGNIQGYTQTLFIVKDGKVEGIETGGPALGGGTDEEVIKCLKSYSNYSSIPDGRYSVKIKFTLHTDRKDLSTEIKNKEVPTVDGYTPLPSEIVIRGYQKLSNSSTKATAESLNEVVVVGRGDVNQSTDKVYDFTALERKPTFPGGFNKFYEYLKTTIKYPAEAQANKTQGKVFLSFVIEANGELSNIRVDRRLGSGTDEEAVRVLAASPKWIPGTFEGKEVRSKFNIPISFTLLKSVPNADVTDVLQGKIKSLLAESPKAPSEENDKVHNFVSIEKQPEFVGGMKKFYEYLGKTVKYPAEAHKNKAAGTVFLSFVVEKDGSLTDIKVDRTAGHGFDEEAVRVMKESPKWIPGMQEGKAVRVKFNIPIKFSLTK